MTLKVLRCLKVMSFPCLFCRYTKGELDIAYITSRIIGELSNIANGAESKDILMMFIFCVLLLLSHLHCWVYLHMCLSAHKAILSSLSVSSLFPRSSHSLSCPLRERSQVTMNSEADRFSLLDER